MPVETEIKFRLADHADLDDPTGLSTLTQRLLAAGFTLETQRSLRHPRPPDALSH